MTCAAVFRALPAGQPFRRRDGVFDGEVCIPVVPR